MSFWSGEKLKQRIPAENLVTAYDPKNVDCAAYTLTLGGSAYTSGDEDDRKNAFQEGRTPGEWALTESGMSVTVRAGQFAFLLTEESVTVPRDAVGFISVKATHKFDGLINVSGFHVDPGWSGRLIFAVFNAGSRDLVFTRGQQLFLLFYSNLDCNSEIVKSNNRQFDRIPSDFMNKMSGDIPSIYSVKAKTRELEREVAELKSKYLLATGTATIAITLVIAIATKLLFFSEPVGQSEKNVTVEIKSPFDHSSRQSGPQTNGQPNVTDRPK